MIQFLRKCFDGGSEINLFVQNNEPATFNGVWIKSNSLEYEKIIETDNITQANSINFITGTDYQTTMYSGEGENLTYCFKEILLTDNNNDVDYETPIYYGNGQEWIDITPIETPYIQLEYIQSSCTQYIDTGFKPYPNAKTFVAEAEMAIISNSNNNDYSIIGTGNHYMGWKISANRVVFAPNATLAQTNIAIDYNNKHSFYINCLTGKYGYDNNQYSFTTGSIDTSRNATWKLFGWGDTQLFACKIYKCKIYNGYEQDGTTPHLVCDLIPVKRKRDNVVCMYDLVTKTFFENQGTGNFIAGNEL